MLHDRRIDQGRNPLVADLGVEQVQPGQVGERFGCRQRSKPLVQNAILSQVQFAHAGQIRRSGQCRQPSRSQVRAHPLVAVQRIERQHLQPAQKRAPGDRFAARWTNGREADAQGGDPGQPGSLQNLRQVLVAAVSETEVQFVERRQVVRRVPEARSSSSRWPSPS